MDKLKKPIFLHNFLFSFLLLPSDESELMAILRVAIITSIHCVPHHSVHIATCLTWLFNLCFVNIQLPHFNVKGENHLELRYIVSKIQWK